MSVFPLLLLLSIIILATVVLSELYAPKLIEEGFDNLPPTSYWSSFVSPRSDIGPVQEDKAFIRDPRYFNDYANVSRIGVPYDFCRMLAPADDPTNLFFACALAGTDGLNSTRFKTRGVKDGFKISYDDYMRDVNGDGRDDYCRIIKGSDSIWQPTCIRSSDSGFDAKEIIDSDPPKKIQTLITFFQGCVVWLRFISDLKDTIGNITVQTSGSIAIDEAPRPELANAITFNGTNQFLRISDSNDLSLGFRVPLRSVRVFMVWAKFTTFTNNAKLFDFGNGRGKDNIFLGILGKGDPSSTSGGELRPTSCANESTVPTGKSGAQYVPEMSPQKLLETSSANINDFECKDFEVYPRKLSPTLLQTTATEDVTNAEYATLIYEVWDKQARKMRIKVNGVIPLKKWVHITVAAMNDDAFRPNIGIYINGKKVLERESGFLPSTGVMTNCYLGKSNWADSGSQYENRDDLFKGSMFDFRMYQGSISETIITETYQWGQKKLNIIPPINKPVSTAYSASASASASAPPSSYFAPAPAPPSSYFAPAPAPPSSYFAPAPAPAPPPSPSSSSVPSPKDSY